MNLGSDSLGKSNDLGVSNVSRIHFGFEFIVNPDPDPIIEYPLSLHPIMVNIVNVILQHGCVFSAGNGCKRIKSR